ncbi:MAG: hypothetical protein ABI200_01250 [Gaiellales bacterium]
MRPVLLVFLIVFLVSCIVGPMLDQIHVITGALSYAHPWLFDQAWWVGPQFGLAFASIAVSTLLIQLRFGTPAPELESTSTIAVQFVWFIAAYLTTGILHTKPVLVLALLAGALVIRTLIERPDVATIRIFVALALLGTAYEAIVSALPETFSYAQGGIFTAPIWLPLLYAHGAPLVRSFMKNSVGLVRRSA